MIAEIDFKNPLVEGKIIGEGVDNATYQRQTTRRGEPEFVMSRGALCEFASCPARWINGVESDESKATEWGTLIDCMVLTPEKFNDFFAVTPETYRSEEKKNVFVDKPWNWNATYCKEWRDKIGAKTPIKFELKQKADDAVKALWADKKIQSVLRSSKKQIMVMGEYHDEDTGIVVPLKGLIDFVPNVGTELGKTLGDFKTCANGSKHVWKKTVFEHNYHVQAALYLDLYVSATGEERLDFVHIIQESFFPYQPGRRLISEEFVKLGRHKYLSTLKRYCQCLKSGVWPGFDDEESRDCWNGWTIVSPEAWMLGV